MQRVLFTIILSVTLGCTTAHTVPPPSPLQGNNLQKSLSPPPSFKSYPSIIINDTIMIYNSREEIKALLHTIKENTAVIYTSIIEAYDLFTQGKYKKAEERIIEAIILGGDLPPAYNLAGIILAKNGKYEDAILHFEKAAALTKDKKKTDENIIALLNKGNILYLKKKLKQAIGYYKKVVEKSSSPDMLQVKADTLANMGMAYLYKWDMDNALHFSTEALELNKISKDKEVDLICSITMSTAYFNREEYIDVFNREPFEDSITHATEAIQIARKLGYRRQEIQAINIFGYVSLESGVIEDAEKLFERSLEKSINASYAIGEVESLSGLAIILRSGDYLSDALEYHTRALEISTKAGYIIGEVKNLIGIADVHNENESFDTALKFYFKALEKTKEIVNKRVKGDLLTKIGLLYYKKNDLDNAMTYYADALMLNKNINYKKGIVNNLTYIGLIHRKKGNDIIALEFSRKSINSASELKFRREKGMSMNNIATIYMNRGNVQEAKRYFLRSYELSSVMGHKSLSIDNMTQLGIIFFQEGAYEKAADYFNNALQVSKKIGAVKYVVDNLIHMGNYYRATNNNEKAMEYYEKALEVSERIVYSLGKANSLALSGVIDSLNKETDRAEKRLKKSLRLYKKLKRAQDIKFVQGLLRTLKEEKQKK